MILTPAMEKAGIHVGPSQDLGWEDFYNECPLTPHHLLEIWVHPSPPLLDNLIVGKSIGMMTFPAFPLTSYFPRGLDLVNVHFISTLAGGDSVPGAFLP